MPRALIKRAAFWLGAALVLGSQSRSQVIGDGWGLDHVALVFESESQAKEIFSSTLGFSVRGASRPPFGFDHAIVDTESAPYIELHWIYDRSKIPDGSGGLFAFELLRRKLDEGGGVGFFMIDVSPLDQAVGLLRKSGVTVSDAKGTTFHVREVSGNGVPYGGPIGLVEYENNADRLRPERASAIRTRVEREVTDPRRSAGEIHANTARRLRSVWVAVDDVEMAARQSLALGFTLGPQRVLAVLGARGRQVEYSQGAIVFWQPSGTGGALSELIRKQGLGPFGLSVGVADIRRAHEIAERGTNSRLPIVESDSRRSFLVPANLVAGAWIEFVQEQL